MRPSRRKERSERQAPRRLNLPRCPRIHDLPETTSSCYNRAGDIVTMAQTSASTILKFAEGIAVSSPTLVPDLRTRIAFFPIDNIQSKQRAAFETKGTELWNLATRHSRDIEDSEQQDLAEVTKNALLRVFAFGMLESVASIRTKKSQREETCMRILKIANRCMKACIEALELDFASKVASRAAEWLEMGKEVFAEDVRGKLEGDYLVWRMTLVRLINDLRDGR